MNVMRNDEYFHAGLINNFIYYLCDLKVRLIQNELKEK